MKHFSASSLYCQERWFVVTETWGSCPSSDALPAQDAFDHQRTEFSSHRLHAIAKSRTKVIHESEPWSPTRVIDIADRLYSCRSAQIQSKGDDSSPRRAQRVLRFARPQRPGIRVPELRILPRIPSRRILRGAAASYRPTLRPRVSKRYGLAHRRRRTGVRKGARAGVDRSADRHDSLLWLPSPVQGH